MLGWTATAGAGERSLSSVIISPENIVTTRLTIPSDQYLAVVSFFYSSPSAVPYLAVQVGDAQSFLPATPYGMSSVEYVVAGPATITLLRHEASCYGFLTYEFHKK